MCVLETRFSAVMVSGMVVPSGMNPSFVPTTVMKKLPLLSLNRRCGRSLDSAL